MTAAVAQRLNAWLRHRPCHWSGCQRPIIAITANGALDVYCERHAAEYRNGGGELLDLGVA